MSSANVAKGLEVAYNLECILQDSISWNCQEHESVPHAVRLCEPAHVHTGWQSKGVLLCLPWVISALKAPKGALGDEI